MDHRIHDAFAAVHAEAELMQNTRRLLAKRIASRKAVGFHRPARRALVFACMFAALLGLGGCVSYYTPTSAISVDVNPSLEMQINCFGRVIAVNGTDADGAAFADTVSIKHQRYTDAVEAILSSEEMTGYLAGGELVTVTVLGANEKSSKRMLSRIAACKGMRDQNVYCCSGNRANAEAAHTAGLSMGKYNAFLELQALDPSITTEEVQGLTMRQIRDRINALSGNTGSAPHGGGHGHGHGRRG